MWQSNFQLWVQYSVYCFEKKIDCICYCFDICCVLQALADMCAGQIMDLRNGFVGLCYNPKFVSLGFYFLFQTLFLGPVKKIFILFSNLRSGSGSESCFKWWGVLVSLLCAICTTVCLVIFVLCWLFCEQADLKADYLASLPATLKMFSNFLATKAGGTGCQ